MITLSLVRHGQTTENTDGTLQGQSPGHLNETGRQQARELRQSLSADNYDLIVCSDLRRTVLTAEILNESLHLPLITNPLLRERDWGEFTGRNIREIVMPPTDFPPSIENVAQLADRAKSFLTFLFDNYDGKRVLAVGHGYFNRCVQAVINETSVRATPRWNNTEVRVFAISRDVLLHQGPRDYMVSEN